MSTSKSTDNASGTSATFLVGGCHCGAVSYQLPLPPNVDVEGSGVSDRIKSSVVPPSRQRFPTRGNRPNQNKWRANHCHCGQCRRTAGALVVDWVNVPLNEATITRKQPTGTYRASNRATREFCSNCGTSLFFMGDDDPEYVDVTVASIITPNVFDYLEFTEHIWVEDVADMVLDEEGKGGGLAGLLKDGLPRFKQGGASGTF